MKDVLTALRVLVLMSVLLGLVYPLAMTGIAQLAFPYQANGSLIVRDGRTVGSELIGQAFTSDRYFHGRPSTVGYDAAASGASNYGPSNPRLAEKIAARVADVRTREHLGPSDMVPADLATASASGLDPHITVEAAQVQVARVVQARHLPPETIQAIIDRNKKHRLVGIRDTAYVNVLKLNLELDGLKP